MVEYAGKVIIIEDISAELPRHATKRWRSRSPAAIKSATLHHTGGRVKTTGRLAAIRTTEFSIAHDNPSTPGLEGRDWPGNPYHLFIPYAPETRDGRLVIYRTNPDGVVTSHSGLWNSESIAVVFQGTFRSRFVDGGMGIEPSTEQQKAWGELRGYLADRLSIGPLECYAHSWRGKPSCPGDTITSWLLEEREKDPGHISGARMIASHLLRLGFWDGTSDDDFGLRRAIARFQRSRWKHNEPLAVDGILGPATESCLKRALRESGAA